MQALPAAASYPLPPRPLSKESVLSCVKGVQSRTITMIQALEEQHQEVRALYEPVHKKLNEKFGEILNKVDAVEGDLSKKEVKSLVHHIQKAESSIIRSLVQAQKKCRKAIGQDKMQKASKAPLLVKKEGLSQVERDRMQEFEMSDLKIREGVVKVKDEIRIAPEFSSKKIKKQMMSLSAQVLSDQERLTIRRDIDLGALIVTSEQCPLNSEIEKTWAKKGIKTRFFSKLFDTFGIAAPNRQERHIINGMRTELRLMGAQKPSFSCFRHGIISSKLVKGKELRRQESEMAAKELALAMLVEHMANRGITPDTLPQGSIPLTITSVSLVTPDRIRHFLNKYTSERRMLADQMEAFQAMEQIKRIEVDGVQIPVTIKARTFNFGVNIGALLGERLHLHGIMGLTRQYKYNKAAWDALKRDVDASLQEMTPDIKKACQSLCDDIERLMKGKTGYFKGGNQYEIGAKIINLCMLMAECFPERGYSAAMNCFSGKDRTGMMDAVAKALHAMKLANKAFPTHHELKHDPDIKEQFRSYVLQFLRESGGLEITELNTGSLGYKLTDVANIIGMTPDEFLSLRGIARVSKV